VFELLAFVAFGSDPHLEIVYLFLITPRVLTKRVELGLDGMLRRNRTKGKESVNRTLQLTDEMIKKKHKGESTLQMLRTYTSMK